MKCEPAVSDCVGSTVFTPTTIGRAGSSSAGRCAKHLADAILVGRDHAGEPEVACRNVTGDLGAAHMPLFDAKHVERLGAVGRDVELGARLHQRADRCVAVARRHGDLVGHLA